MKKNVLNFFIPHFHIKPEVIPYIYKNVNYKKGCTRLPPASDKVYQLLAHGRWFSPGTSSTTKTGRHDIAEILLKVTLNTKNQPIFVTIYYFSTLVLR
jgi:hypothetical protein